MAVRSRANGNGDKQGKSIDYSLFKIVLNDEQLEQLADAVARRVAELLPEPAEDGWLDSREMADYLGVPLSTVRALTARGELPSYQDREGGNHYGKRSELDDWRRSNLPRR